MKTIFAALISRSSAATLLIMAACAGFAPGARAGLSLEMNLIRYDPNGYYFSPYLMTNNTAPNIPFGDYQLASPQSPTNGIFPFHYHFDTNGFNQVGGFPWGYSDFNSVMQQLTNGAWSIFVTNSIETNVYHFNVTANIGSNSLPVVSITFPTNGAVNVTNQPDYTWQGPTNYSDLALYAYDYGSYLPVTQTDLVSPNVLYQGMNSVTVHYDSNSVSVVVSSVPLDSLAHPISSWVSTAHLQDFISSQFSVGIPDTSGTSHALVAHYPFDANSGPVLDAAVDTSGNGYDMSFGSSFGSQGGVNLTSDPAAGVGAVQFHDGDGNSAGYLGWNNPTPPALLSALAGNFSISCWIKTSQSFAWDSAPAYYGVGIVSADNNGQANDLIPLALTGGKIGFNTGGDVEDVTLNSSAYINDGNYHHIVVTRNQQTGQKIIYIDSAFDSFGSGTTNLLSDPQKLTIGALADASDPNPTDFNYYNGYDGELDDVQIYSGALSAGDVAYLYANPGSTVANGGGAASGGHTNLAYYSFEDDNLFAHDFSEQGNTIGGYSWFSNPPYMTNDAAAGSYAVGYDGSGWQNPPTNLVAALAGSFSVSLWAKTTNSPGNNSDTADSGAGLLAANYDQVIPIALTGSKLAFLTGGGTPDTLHSATSINTGSYVHLVVTRDQGTGEKKIYVNGSLDAADFGTPGPLNTSSSPSLFLGMNTSYAHGFIGDMDEVQIYSGVLSSNEVAHLYNHPGTNIADTTGYDFNTVLNTTGLVWTTTGDDKWFVKNTNTFNNSPAAAQSGSITNYQSSTLSVTVTGSGRLIFAWSSIAEDPNQGFYYEFDIDGVYKDTISGDTAWYQEEDPQTGLPYVIPSGQHTLTWTTYANGDTDPTEAGFLDQVTFVPPDTSPVSADITFDIYREQDPTFGDFYIAFPSFNSVTPAAIGNTTNTVQSPSGWFSTETDSGGGTGSSSLILFSLDQLLNECTNGLWTLDINKGLANERRFQFSATVSGLTTNLLSAVQIITPTNGATGVPANTSFQWTGPTNYSTLTVYKQNTDYSGFVVSPLPATATSWPSPPILSAGTNRFNIEYISNNFPNMTFTMPTNSVDSQTASNWVTLVNLHSTAMSLFVVTAGPLPVTVLNPQNFGADFKLQFLSQSGFTHAVQYRTNLVSGNWQTYSNVIGDGTLKTIPVPLSVFNQSQQGFIRVSTQ